MDHSACITMQKLAVVGGGPVGCVMALTLKELGYSVDLYECRGDIRRECKFVVLILRPCMASC